MKKIIAWIFRMLCFAVIALALFTVGRSFLHRNDDHSREALLGASAAATDSTADASEMQNTKEQLIAAEADAKQKLVASKAEADSVRALAEAQAEANRKLAQSVTNILIEYEKIEKWDGRLPAVSGSGTLVCVDGIAGE